MIKTMRSKLIGKIFRLNTETGHIIFDNDYYFNTTCKIVYTPEETALLKNGDRITEIHKLKKYFNGEVIK